MDSLVQTCFKSFHLTYLIVLFCFVCADAIAQGAVGKEFKDKNKEYYDSLKTMNYDRLFPIWGSRIYKKGYDIPFPFGIMVNNFYGIQGIDISNISIGIHTPSDSYGPAD